MKKILVVTAIIASSHALAQGVIPSVDYSHCQQAIGVMGGPQLNDRGELSPGFGQQANPDVKTEEMAGFTHLTYTFKSQALGLKGKPQEMKYKVTKDKLGNVVEVYTAQDKIDPGMVNMHKQWALNGAVYSGVTQDSLAYDPMVMVSSADNGQMIGGKYLPLSKLSKEQAKQFGVDIDDLRSLKKQVKKDKKTLAKISDGYMKLLNKSHMMLPNGVDVEMKVIDGVCRPQSVTPVVYDSNAKVNNAFQKFDHERCENVLKIQKKYSKQLEACANTNFQMYQEMNPQGVQGGYVGGMQGGVNGVGMAGGYPMGGGYGMGYNSEMAQCQQYFGEMPQGGYGMGGGIAGGSAGGYSMGQKSEVKQQ